MRELTKSPGLQPIPMPVAPESGFTPSPVLMDFGRDRDDIDHTIPFGDGGATRPPNLKCRCQKHHLVKTFGGGATNSCPTAPSFFWDIPHNLSGDLVIL